MYLNSESHNKSVAAAAGNPINEDTDQPVSQVTALRIDFVTKAGDTRDIASEVGSLLARSGLDREGLRASMVLVSDREARLVTLLTLWEAHRFNSRRDRLTSWTLKLVARFADKQPRAHTSAARFLIPQTTSKLTLSDLRPAEIAELVEILSAG